MNFELLILVFSLFTLHNYWPTGNRDNSRTLKNILIALRKPILFKPSITTLTFNKVKKMQWVLMTADNKPTVSKNSSDSD